ncbi:MAG: squalene/phytoene synthase family protein [Alphaproteobacteria bacterium]|nr:squalene/phytoene synthase family protein [Alphaproteobacteria bacterium]
MDRAPLEPLDDLIARVEPDRYVASFFAPAERRRDLLGLYAFDHEVARIGEIVREPMVGHIRFGWWREQVSLIYSGGEVVAPVARALAEAVRAHDLPRDLFERYLDARAFDLEEAPFADAAALERYAVAVSGGIMALGARVLGCAARADAAAELGGCAEVYARILTSVGVQAERRHCRLPLDWLEAARLGPEDVFAGDAAAALSGVTARLAGQARAALTRLRGQNFPTRATPVLAAATTARWAIALALKPAFDPYAPMRALPAWQRVARIAFANLAWRI